MRPLSCTGYRQAVPSRTVSLRSTPPLTRSPLLWCRGWHRFSEGSCLPASRFSQCETHQEIALRKSKARSEPPIELGAALCFSRRRPFIPAAVRILRLKSRELPSAQLFQIVLGFTPLRRLSRAYQSQNDLEQLLTTNYHNFNAQGEAN